MPLSPDLPSLPLGSFLEIFEAGPVEPFDDLLFFETALALEDFEAGVALLALPDVFATALVALAGVLDFGAGLALALVSFGLFAVDLEVLTAVTDFFVLGSLLEPAVRAAFFGAAGAFATWSSRPKAFPGITKTHVKSDKSV